MLTTAITATPERATAVAVTPSTAAAACRLVTGALSPRLLGRDARGARVALVATGALLLGGDHVRIELEVAGGAWLDVVETAGTVAYDGGGTPSTWSVHARLGPGARMRWNGLPFVVADGAAVRRTTTLDLAEGARALVRETLVRGRTGEPCGELRSLTDARIEGRPVLVEDLDAGAVGAEPGALGGHRVIDQVLAIGWRPPPSAEADAPRFDLAGPGALVRLLSDATHRTHAVDAAETAWRTAVAP